MSENSRTDNVGDDLVKRDYITREELDAARDFERSTGIPWYRQLLQAGKIGFSALEDSLRYEFHPKSLRLEHQNLGETLVKMDVITREQLNEALEEQDKSGRLLGVILLEKGAIDSETMMRALARQHGLEFARLEDAPSHPKALEAVPESVALRNRMLPASLDGDRLTVLVAEPQSREALKDAGVLLGLRVYPLLTYAENFKADIRARYENHENVSSKPATPSNEPKPNHAAAAQTEAADSSAQTSATQEADEADRKKDMSEEQSTNRDASRETRLAADRARFNDIAEQASGVPVIKLVQTIIEGAANSAATDIHLDPQEPEMRVRYRIDGLLHDVMSISEEIESAVISRVKLLADLDITETRHPQDGHFRVAIAEREFDIRVATMPTIRGERVVLRLLDQTSVLAGLRDLGLQGADRERLERLIEQPYGMILVTGPTGSGKTTTLYAALNQKNVLEESIVTLEDPVEYQISGINQVQIESDIERTFAETLRASLRQDIDVLLVGEIRDQETAHIAVRAAMTGHLVFSTLHTNDALEAIATLENMEVPSYLIASALTAVVAQRLVLTICPHCKEAFKPDEPLLEALGVEGDVDELYRGAGCSECYQTGKRGRTGVFEVLEATKDVRRLIAAKAGLDEIAEAGNLKSLTDDCREKVLEGLVSPEEYIRISRS
jgi:type IV pilus assembly protein PilB